MDGSFKAINTGLRQPNGIGLGPDGEIFVLENQGEWVPSNKLILPFGYLKMKLQIPLHNQY